MALQPAQNDSIITTGLDVVEETEQSAGEIATSLAGEAAPVAGPDVQTSAPEQDQDQAALQEA